MQQWSYKLREVFVQFPVCTCCIQLIFGGDATVLADYVLTLMMI